MKILIVDDSSFIRNMHKAILKEYNLTDENFLEAGDGKTALEIAKKENIDLFLVDWNMPKLDGLEFVKNIRCMDKYKNTPIIMITSEAAKYNVLEAIKAGVTNYIVKPIQGNVLWEKLQQYIK